MWEDLLSPDGRSIKRLIPVIAFGILTIELILSHIPFLQPTDNQTEIILNICDVMGWVIASGFGFTAVEKFSRKRRRNENENDTETDFQG